MQKDITAQKRKIKLNRDIGLVDFQDMQNYSDLNHPSVDSGKPYTNLEVTDDYIIREFSENIDPIELLWHRDDEDRTIEILEDTDWQIQLEDKLPTSLKDRIFIARHEWHRVIKGTGTLTLKIHKT